MAGIIQAAINSALRSSAKIGKLTHAGQTGENPSTEAEGEKMGLGSMPSPSVKDWANSQAPSIKAWALSNFALEDKRDSKRLNDEGIEAKRRSIKKRMGKMAPEGKEGSK